MTENVNKAYTWLSYAPPCRGYRFTHIVVASFRVRNVNFEFLFFGGTKCQEIKATRNILSRALLILGRRSEGDGDEAVESQSSVMTIVTGLFLQVALSVECFNLL